MKVLFVCTGNICRSPMGELLFPLFFRDGTVTADSAGLQGLDASGIDPSSARLLEQDGIDASGFRSKRFTPRMADDSDLVLCFTDRQRADVIGRAPRAAKRTFTLTEFANLCAHCSREGLIEGDGVDERAACVMEAASMARPHLPVSEPIADPYRREFEAFETAHRQIAFAIAGIADALEPSHALHGR